MTSKATFNCRSNRIPCDKKAIASELEKYESLITVEEHVLQGGFGSYILEILADAGKAIRTRRIGIDMEKGYPDFFGGRAYMEKYFGIDKDSLVETIR